jgi:hypothetical protein
MAQDVNLDTQIPAELDEKLSRLHRARREQISIGLRSPG